MNFSPRFSRFPLVSWHKTSAFLFALCFVIASNNTLAKTKLPAPKTPSSKASGLVHLPNEVLRALQQARIPSSAISAYVDAVDGKTPAVSISFQANIPRNPASTIKLITSHAALLHFGASHRFVTRFYRQGTLENGVLQGNLVLIPSGDPSIKLEQLWLMMRELHLLGVQRIQGNIIVLPQGLFVQTNTGNDSVSDDTPWASYHAPPSEYLLNFSALRIMLDTDHPSLPFRVDPTLEGLTIINQLKPAKIDCDSWKSQIQVNTTRLGASTQVLLLGKIASGCGIKNLLVHVLPSQDYTPALLKTLWLESGGILDGKVLLALNNNELNSLIKNQQLPLLYNAPSASLAEIIRDMNKFSNNVIAKMLYLHLTQEVSVSQLFSQNGLNLPSLKLENGSGLSRQERISALDLVSLLQGAYASPHMPEFLASLPITGQDGTMRKRGTASGYARIKTGLLHDVAAIAGYVQSKSGKRYAVAAFVNYEYAIRARQALDALIEWVHQHG